MGDEVSQEAIDASDIVHRAIMDGARENEIRIRTSLESLGLDVNALGAISLLHGASLRLRYQMERVTLSKRGLSSTGLIVLTILLVWGELEAFELAEKAGVSKGTLTGVVKNLERRDLVRRSTHERDRRRVLISITELGDQVVREVIPVVNQTESEIFRVLNSSEQAQLILLLRKLLNAAWKVSPSTPARS